jgi:hypothetical protein
VGRILQALQGTGGRDAARTRTQDACATLRSLSDCRFGNPRHSRLGSLRYGGSVEMRRQGVKNQEKLALIVNSALFLYNYEKQINSFGCFAVRF